MLTFLLGIIKIKRDIVFAASLYLWEVDINWLWKTSKKLYVVTREETLRDNLRDTWLLWIPTQASSWCSTPWNLRQKCFCIFWCCGFDFSVHFGLQIPQDNLRSVLQRTACPSGPGIYWGVKRHFFDQRMTLNCDTHSSRTFICSLLGYTSWTYDW